MNWLYIIKKDNSSWLAKIICIILYCAIYLVVILLASNLFYSWRYLITALIFLYFILFIIPAFVYPFWAVSEDKLVLVYLNNYRQKWRYILTRKANLIIPFTVIDKIKISYIKTSATFIYNNGYSLIFEIQLIDGNIIKMDALFNADKTKFVAAIRYMQKHGVKFEDHLKLIKVIESGYNLYQYIQKLEV